jgi:hypothetical protein
VAFASSGILGGAGLGMLRNTRAGECAQPKPIIGGVNCSQEDFLNWMLPGLIVKAVTKRVNHG